MARTFGVADARIGRAPASGLAAPKGPRVRRQPERRDGMNIPSNLIVASVLAASGFGCASITGSEMQSVLVTTKTKAGEPVEDSKCVLTSPRGKWNVTTPSSVAVQRSSEDIEAECRKEGHSPGLAKLVSRAHGGMFGNIIFGGGIGAIIDHNKGTGYEYPNKVEIVMGESVLIDRKQELDAERRK
jgi:hypothetical protein